MQNETIIMTGCEPWEHWRQTHNIAHIWARNNKVIFIYTDILYENLRGEKGRLHYFKRFWNQEIHWVTRNLAVLDSPPMLPVAVSILSRFYGTQIHYLSIQISKILQAKIIRHKLKKEGLFPTVLSIWRPFDLLFAGRMGEKIACWHLYDEVARFPQISPSHNTIEKVEKEKIHLVDLIFAASENMFKKRKKSHSGIHLIPNAGEFSLFNKALKDDLPEPDDLKTIPHPRIGLIGSLYFGIDFDLLGMVADRHPEWSLVLIGKERKSLIEKTRALTARSNVFHIGYRPQPQLPYYLKGFDVGLMPYLVAHSIIDGYPLKMHEYLAAGLPIVSTAQPAVLPFSHVVSIAEDASQFVALIEEAMLTNSPEKVRARVAVARENSWEKRVEEMNSLINHHLL